MSDTNQNIKESVALNISPKEAGSAKPAEKQKEPLETVETKPREDNHAAPREEKPVPPAAVILSPKEIAKVEPKIKRKPKRKPKPNPQLQIPERPKKWEDKWVNVNGEKVLFIPSGFEIMTKNGWRPIMERADKIQK